jgi:hypothetical protein
MSTQLVTFLHSESGIGLLLLCGLAVAFATFPGILAVLATATCLGKSEF